MNIELKKLKDSNIKISQKQITLKEIFRQQNSQFDQIYFKTEKPNQLLKIYGLEQNDSQEKFNHQKQQYEKKVIPLLAKNVQSHQIQIKKKNYGIILFSDLGTAVPLNQKKQMTDIEIKKLVTVLLENLIILKNQGLIFCNFRLENIFQVNDQFVLINAEYVKPNSSKNEMDTFFIETVDSNWQYWPPQILDLYSKEIMDYSIDVYAIGCLLYQLLEKRYPFETKLKAENNQFKKISKGGILSHLTNTCLGNLQTRKNIKLKQFYKVFASASSTQIELDVKQKYLQNKNQLETQQSLKKTKSNGLFQNLSIAFLKLINDDEGNFFNYTEENQKNPEEKYIDRIIQKLYHLERRNQNIQKLIIKSLQNCSQANKYYSILKTLLMIGQILRKGPKNYFSSELKTQYLQKIAILFKNKKQIVCFSQLLEHRMKVMDKVKKCLCGNFYLSDIAEFRLLTLSDLSEMVVYLQKLISFLRLRIKFKQEKMGLQQIIINFACDDIFDLISMIILSIICIRKDNSIQLRTDNLKDLFHLEKMLNNCLKNISDLSFYVDGHAIYSLEREYIAYQEEIHVKMNPYYSTFEYFKNNCRSYKGLAIPQDYKNTYSDQKFTQNSRKMSNYIQKSEQSISQQSQQEKEVKEQTGKRANFDQFLNLPPKNYCLTKSSGQNQKKNKKEQLQKKKEIQLSSQNNSRTTAANNIDIRRKSAIFSLNQFANISQQQHKTTQNTKFNDFNFFDSIKKQSKGNQKIKNSSTQKQLLSQFPSSQKVQKGQKNRTTSTIDFNIFNEIAHKQKPQKQKVKTNSNVNAFFQQFGKSKSEQPEIKVKYEISQRKVKNEKKPSKHTKQDLLHNLFGIDPQAEISNQNTLTDNLLKKLKLKELKQLLKKNKKYVIDFKLFKIKKAIGSGSAGSVYLGKYKNMEVAVKKVKVKENPNALKQFQRELVTYLKIGTHPYLVALVGVSQYEGNFFLITQFCTSGNLFDLLHNRIDIAISWAQCLRFALQIAEGMNYLHEMKPVIIHRDLKSLNVFVTKENDKLKMKVADFGLSRSLQAEVMTTQLGTIHWMAPELLEGSQYSLKVDVYSYGILLWEILSRRAPYANLKNVMAIIKYVVMDQKRPEVQIIELECPHQLILIMTKCWAHDPLARPSFSEIIASLKSIQI